MASKAFSLLAVALFAALLSVATAQLPASFAQVCVGGTARLTGLKRGTATVQGCQGVQGRSISRPSQAASAALVAPKPTCITYPAHMCCDRLAGRRRVRGCGREWTAGRLPSASTPGTLLSTPYTKMARFSPSLVSLLPSASPRSPCLRGQTAAKPAVTGRLSSKPTRHQLPWWLPGLASHPGTALAALLRPCTHALPRRAGNYTHWECAEDVHGPGEARTVHPRCRS